MTALEQKVADIINFTLGESLELNGSEILDWPKFNEDSLKRSRNCCVTTARCR